MHTWITQFLSITVKLPSKYALQKDEISVALVLAEYIIIQITQENYCPTVEITGFNSIVL